jgi:hypothetical protein
MKKLLGAIAGLALALDLCPRNRHTQVHLLEKDHRLIPFVVSAERTSTSSTQAIRLR